VGISFRRPKIVALEGGTGGPDIELGARVREVRESWTTLLDPEDNPFCVLDP